MKKIVISFFVLLTFGYSQANALECKDPAKTPLAVGQKVVATWQGNNWWTANITAIKGEYIEVKYSDNTTGIKKQNEVVAHPELLYAGGIVPCLKVGEKVVSVWQGNSWWTATIDKLTEDIAEITYSDGEKGIHKLNEMVHLP